MFQIYILFPFHVCHVTFCTLQICAEFLQNELRLFESRKYRFFNSLWLRFSIPEVFVGVLLLFLMVLAHVIFFSVCTWLFELNARYSLGKLFLGIIWNREGWYFLSEKIITHFYLTHGHITSLGLPQSRFEAWGSF